MFSKLFSRDSNKKSIRIKADAGNPTEKYISIQLTQSFDYLEFLSLKLSQKDAYRLFDSDYGVVAGRVIGNEGIGLPNCKVSIFISIDEDDFSALETRPKTVSEVIKSVGASLYPFTNVSDENNEGVRYNLLPSHKRNRGFNGFPANIFGIGATPKTPVGTFPDKEEVIVNPSFMYIYEKYYKFTTVTNDAGDFMLFGVPTGNHVLHMDCDLTDIGRWSISPLMMNKVLGYPDSLFINEGSKIEASTDLSTLPNIQSHNIPVFVKPLWSQNEGSTTVGVTRQDFKVTGDIVPHFNMFLSGFRQSDDTYIGDRIFFRLIIKSALFWRLRYPTGINFKKWSISWSTICLYRPDLSESEFLLNRECQMCGGKYDLPPFTVVWDYRVFDRCESNMLNNSSQYVTRFNDYIKNLTPTSQVSNWDDFLYKTWIGGTNTNQRFLDRINEIRVNGNLKKLPLNFSVFPSLLEDTAAAKAEDLALIMAICKGEETDETLVASEMNTEYSGTTAYTELAPASINPDDWTNKFDLASTKTDKLNARVFSYKNNPELTNQVIETKSNVIDPERHIRMLQDNEFVSYSSNGLYLAQIPCNRTRVVTTEDGRVVPTDDLNKGVFSEFAGYFLFDMEGNIENPPTRMRTGRVTLKVPQSVPVYTDNTSNGVTNDKWIKENQIFKSGELYSVAQYFFSHSTRSYEDKIGFIARPNDIGSNIVERTRDGLVLHGFPYTNTYKESTGNGQASVNIFENNWLNFNLYFLQFMYKTRSKSKNNFVCKDIISNKHKQLANNNDSVGGGVKNTKWIPDGSKFKTRIVKVNKSDFIKFFTKQDAGFTSGLGVVLEMENKGDYAKNTESSPATFYKGYFTDSIKALIDKDLV
jgi:hypothetical protein